MIREWINRVILRKTTQCFSCFRQVDKKTVTTVDMNTAEGALNIKACPACADDINDVLKAIEEARGESNYG